MFKTNQLKKNRKKKITDKKTFSNFSNFVFPYFSLLDAKIDYF